MSRSLGILAFAACACLGCADESRPESWEAWDSGTTYALRSIWGSANALYVSGSYGTILRLAESGHTGPEPSGTTADLPSVWGRGDIAVAVGGAIVRTTGHGWQTVPNPTTRFLLGVWMGPSFAFAVGEAGTILRSRDDGASWVLSPSGVTVYLDAVWGDSSGDVFAVGEQGTILKSVDEGSSWAPLASGTDAVLTAVWGTSAGDVFVVGDAGVLLHSADGVTWQMEVSGTPARLLGGFSLNGGPRFAVGKRGTILHSAGGGWVSDESGTAESLNGVWAHSTVRVFAVGDDGLLLSRWLGQELAR